MKGILSKVLIFAAGAAVGSAITWRILKTKYEKLATEEIELAYKRFSKKEDTEEVIKNEPESKEMPHDEIDIGLTDLRDKLKQLGYTDYEHADFSNIDYSKIDYSKVLNKEGGIKTVMKPRIITPEEFEEEEDYEIVGLCYYTDGVLADEFGDVVDDVEGTVGCDSLNHFGDYEDDPECVYVKNDELQIVYEILLTNTTYSNNDHKQVSDT